MMNLDPHPDTLVTITCDKEGLNYDPGGYCCYSTTDNWNFGDEYDLDLTPYHDMRDSLIKEYVEVYGNDDITI